MSETTQPEEQKPSVYIRSDGVTSAERYLKKLCDRTFLSFWSHAGVYRDQGKKTGIGDGKEVCDVLVVFDRHIIIFSDKDCQYPDTGNAELDWCRWYRRAIENSAKQVWGAERWIREHPDRLFSDRACTQKFPVPLPPIADAKFHRIIVAHDASRRCRETHGGSGSLMLVPTLVGTMHYDPQAEFPLHWPLGVAPFTIGQVDPTKGYVHVFDDTTLDIILKNRDTISDFVHYLTRKEAFIESGRLLSASGEEDLLAFYLKGVDAQGEHDFILPKHTSVLVIQEGMWLDFSHSPERQAQIDADVISYAWDDIIDRFSHNFMNGTSYFTTHHSYQDQEKLFRFFARETRLRRRMLSKVLIELIRKAKPDQRGTRIVLPTSPGDPYYAFLTLQQPNYATYDEYRKVRARLLQALCAAVKLQFPDAHHIVGLATEPGSANGGRSEDAGYIDASEWSEEDDARAKEDRHALGLLMNLNEIYRHENEYPKPVAPTQLYELRRNIGKPQSLRNSLCRCGSGMKFKFCCGRRT